MKIGAVAVNGTKIYRVGTFDEIKALANVDKIIDLGNAIIIPGLINIHTHLDLDQPAQSHQAHNQFYPLGLSDSRGKDSVEGGGLYIFYRKRD